MGESGADRDVDRRWPAGLYPEMTARPLAPTTTSVLPGASRCAMTGPAWAARLRATVLTVGAVVGVVCGLWFVGLWVLGLKPLVFPGGSMALGFGAGDVEFARTVPAATVEPGDVVSIVTDDGVRATDRVVEVTPEPGGAHLWLTGDAVDPVVEYSVSQVDLVVGYVPHVGSILLFAESREGMVLGVALLLACLMLGFWPPGCEPGPPRPRPLRGKGAREHPRTGNRVP